MMQKKEINLEMLKEQQNEIKKKRKAQLLERQKEIEEERKMLEKEAAVVDSLVLPIIALLLSSFNFFNRKTLINLQWQKPNELWMEEKLPWGLLLLHMKKKLDKYKHCFKSFITCIFTVRTK